MFIKRNLVNNLKVIFSIFIMASIKPWDCYMHIKFRYGADEQESAMLTILEESSTPYPSLVDLAA
jgi:hypothetical protein